MALSMGKQPSVEQVCFFIVFNFNRVGMTMVVVTHEIRFARDVADRVVFMEGGDVIEQGTPQQVIDNPPHERTRKFLNVVGQ
jgi:ABC-type polar amino acid transport system ATPase subunit